MFPAAFLDEVVARNPIEDVVSQYVAMTRKGSNLFGLCPFHGEKTASFSVAPDKGIFYCFGCHKGGGVINFIMEIENLSYADAVRFLAKRAGLEVPDDPLYQSQYKKQERLWALSKEAARYFNRQLYEPAGREGLEYAIRRGLSKNTLIRFGVGFAPNGWNGLLDAMKAKQYTEEELVDAGLALRHPQKGTVYDRFRNRLMFPIIDVRGHVIGFGGRVMDDSTPKYLNSPETLIFNKRKNLFGMNLSKKSKSGKMILVEGYMDAVALHQYGFDYAVASLGTALTPDQVTLLAKYTEQVILIYDSDEAGQNATRRAIPLLEKAGLSVRVLQMKGAKDPDEFLKKYGPDRFRILMEGAENQIEYELQALGRKYDLRQDDQKVEFLQKAAETLAAIGNAVQREVYGNRIAEAAGITYDSLKIEIEKALRRKKKRDLQKQQRMDLSPAEKQRPKSRSIRYDNLKSAMAEEALLGLILKEPDLLDQIHLEPTDFSCELLGRCYGQLRRRYENDLQVSLSVLENLSPEETAHMAGVAQKQVGPVDENAVRDCVSVIRREQRFAQADEEDDLLALRDALRRNQNSYGN